MMPWKGSSLGGSFGLLSSTLLALSDFASWSRLAFRFSNAASVYTLTSSASLRALVFCQTRDFTPFRTRVTAFSAVSYLKYSSSYP